MSATIRVVAKLAGCSIKTVSRVVNNEPNVSVSTRQRVLDAIRNTGYVPNLTARRLVNQKSYSLCVIMYPGFYNSSPTFLSRLLDLGYEENYEILIQNYYPNRSKSQQRVVELVNQRRFDGFISTPPCDSDGFLIDFLSTYKIPVVQVNPLINNQDLIFVSGDDVNGAYQLTKYLISLGHTKIACFKGPRNLRSSQDRFSGFISAIEESKISQDEGYIQDTEYTFDGGANALRLLMRQKEPPSAIFAGHDESALGALFTAREMGINVPNQLSIAGFEDLPMASQVWPRMTTYHQPADDLLYEATRLLISCLKNTPCENKQITLTGKLVERNSTSRIDSNP
jgi:LacI family transcriptional regulator